jgi:ribosomal protein S18 acetylase RimI-like enzyme
MQLHFEIINFRDLIGWCMDNDHLRIKIENLMRAHTKNKSINIGSLIENNLRWNHNIPLQAKIIVGIESDNVVGMALAEFTKEDIYYISNVHIKDAYRGQGFCQKLLSALINTFTTGTFELDVNGANVSAIKCYERAGFIITKTKDIGDSQTGYTMRLVKNKQTGGKYKYIDAEKFEINIHQIN